MIGPRPIAPARWIVAVTILVLPADARDRYREELRTELSDMRGPAQLLSAASLLVGSMALRNALRGRTLTVIEHQQKDWRCRIGRHHYIVRQDDNPEMRRLTYLQCTRCGKPKDPPSYGPMPLSNAVGPMA